MEEFGKTRKHYCISRSGGMKIYKWNYCPVQERGLYGKKKGNFIWVAGYEDQEEDACKTRIHTSVSVYHTYKDKCEKTRNGTLKRKLAFFDEVGEFPPINKSFADWRARQDFFTILEKIYLRKTRRRKAGEKEERRPRVSVQTGTSTF